MKILTLNCGSSSIKYQMFNMEEKKVLAKGLIEKIGLLEQIQIHQPLPVHRSTGRTLNVPTIPTTNNIFLLQHRIMKSARQEFPKSPAAKWTFQPGIR